MESPIKDLLEKYWAGETNLAEEQQIKAHFKDNPALTEEGKYFRSVSQKQTKSDIRFRHPGKAARRTQWSVAAALIIGILAAALIIGDARKQREFAVEDPQEAFEITRRALLMVSSGLNEGKVYSQEITKINKAEELISDTESIN